MANRNIGVSIRAPLPQEWVKQSVTQDALNQQSGGVPVIGVFQPIVATTPTVRVVSSSSTSTSSGGGTSSSGAPMQVVSISATESPYKTADGVLRSLVAVSFEANPSDKNFGGAQVWFTNYHGAVNPQLIATAVTSPVSFLCDTTHETITVTVQAISLAGVAAPFAGAPTTTVTLDGVVSPPPPPTIAQNVVALPNSQGWQFAWNVIGGLEADVIAGYYVYRSTSGTTPTPPTGRFKSYVQPTTNIGTLTEQDTSAGATTYYYWVSSYNTSGLESSLVDANVASTLGSFYPSTHSGTNTYTNPTNAYDGNESSSASATDFIIYTDPGTTSGSAQDVTYSGWSLATGSPTTLTLSIMSQVTFSVGTYSVISGSPPRTTKYQGSGTGTAVLEYSLNGGSTWTTVYTVSANSTHTSGNSRAKQYDYITLSPTQDLTQVRVKATNTIGTGIQVTINHQLFEIRVDATF